MTGRLYEVLIALDISVPGPDAEALIAKLKALVTEAKGEIKDADKQGVRKLAFKVRGRMEAQFWILRYEAPPSVVKQVESVLRLNEGVVRYMTTRLDPSLLVSPKPAAAPAAPAPQSPQQPAQGASVPPPPTSTTSAS